MSKYDITQEQIDQIYKAYPGRCWSGRSTGKTLKDKDRIKRVISRGYISHSELLSTQESYVDDCTSKKTYIKNYSTFLNNLPDMSEAEPVAATVDPRKGIWY